MTDHTQQTHPLYAIDPARTTPCCGMTASQGLNI
jgi:hypothetical protein